ncbi:MAG: adenosylcobinamide-GDP ribazoletransferase [Candidatus Omnitrophica bacterium]|nr:adenosylcobinamide-GDP ribazoletransferase [Candidatus Omnitrophota bacterium]
MRGFLIALGFLTKIPVARDLPENDKSLADSTLYFPLVGFFLGFILILINTILAQFLPERIVNLGLVIFLVLITGAMHLDGFADTIDGFCSKFKNKKEVLDIMRDPRIGSMGVIGLILLILAKYELLNAIPVHLKDTALILMCTLSRWGQVAAAAFSSYAREGSGTGRPFIGNIAKKVFYLATALTVMISIVGWFPKGILVFCLVSLLIFMAIKYAQKRIDGMTGDTVGAVNELAEVIALFGIYILWTL